MSESAQACLDKLIDDFHRNERIRVWSLVITVFGDAVNPRGGEIWLGSLQDLMQRLGVEPGALRAAMSRLTSDGWLVRIREGRNSYYRLARAGEAEFTTATRRIYTTRKQTWDGRWSVVLAGHLKTKRKDVLRRDLLSAGFGMIGRDVFLRPEPEDGPEVAMPGGDAFVMSARLTEETRLQDLIRAAWNGDGSRQGFETFERSFAPLLQALQDGSELDPISAMAARTLLIHMFRRAVLREPGLPSELAPSDWAGDEARVLAEAVYSRLAAGSELWLDSCSRSGGDPLPAPAIDIATRFGAG
jgi:phenylacetic acid degradation operon negative regulatory protein